MIGVYILAAPFVFAFVLLDDLVYWAKRRRVFHNTLHWPLNQIALCIQAGAKDQPPLG